MNWPVCLNPRIPNKATGGRRDCWARSAWPWTAILLELDAELHILNARSLTSSCRPSLSRLCLQVRRISPSSTTKSSLASQRSHPPANNQAKQAIPAMPAMLLLLLLQIANSSPSTLTIKMAKERQLRTDCTHRRGRLPLVRLSVAVPARSDFNPQPFKLLLTTVSLLLHEHPFPHHHRYLPSRPPAVPNLPHSAPGDPFLLRPYRPRLHRP